MRKKLRPLVALTVIALISLIGAGCGSSQPSTTDGAGNAPSKRDQGVKFADCMRNAGITDFPDPDSSGDFDYGVSVSPSVWTQALKACKDLQPPGSLSSDRTPKQQSDGLRFAKCIRENGVDDFPDPVKGEPIINTYKIPSSNKPGGMAILNAAIEKCKVPLDKAASGQ